MTRYAIIEVGQFLYIFYKVGQFTNVPAQNIQFNKTGYVLA